MGKYEADRSKAARDKAEVDKAYRQMTDSPTRKQPSPQQIASRRRALKKQKIALITGGSILLVLLIGVIIGMIVYSNRPGDDGKILPNVYAAGIDLGGMSREEAASALHLATDKTFSQKDMVITLPDSSLTLSPSDTHAALDVDAVVEAAYSYGRTGTESEFEKAKKNAANTTYTIALLPYLQLDLDYIQTTIRSFCDSYGSALTQPTAHLEGDRPAYDPEYPDLRVTHQTLIITMGTPDYALDAGKVYDRVLDAYSLNEMTVTYEAPTLTEPTVPDATALFDGFCIAPQDATMDDVTYEVTPEVYGYGFDIDSLQKKIDAAEYGQTIEIQLGFIMPNVTSKELTEDLFVDTLSSYTTSASGSSSDRNTNLELSAQAINGIVIKAGEEFSFNNTVGNPTAQKGYKPVTELRNGKETTVLGGGISQTASALYYCALMADLDILERHSNEYAVGYTQLGLDAFVDWGARDLRIRNNTGAPIRIIAYANGSDVSVQLLGEEDKGYTVQINAEIVGEELPETIVQVVAKNNVYNYTDGQIMQTGITGYEVQTSVDKFDDRTGQLISSTLVDTSTYAKRDQIVISIESEPEETDPTDPTAPSDPTDPIAPADPSEPTDPENSVETTEPSGSLDFLLP